MANSQSQAPTDATTFIQNRQDQLRANATTDLARIVLTREVGESKLSLQVSPCTWMYPNYPLQVSITLAGDGGETIVADNTKSIKTGTVGDLQRLLDGVKLVACKCCGKPAFDPDTVKTNRNGSCETCFVTSLQAEFNKVHEAEMQQVAERDKKHKAEGFTHRVTAWVHPESGGDDFQLDLYFKDCPPKATVEAALRAQGSMELTDWGITQL